MAEDDLFASVRSPTSTDPAMADDLFASVRGPSKASAAPSKGALSYADDLVRSLAQGATFGFADEIAAAANTLPLVGTGKSYEENLAAEKARNEAIPTAIRVPGEIGGAVAGTIAAAPATAAAAGATGVAKLPGLVRSILGGGAAGALFGAGNAEPGLENRAVGVGEGAALGGAIGGVAYPVVKGIASTVNAVRGAVQPRTQAAADLARAFTRDETTPAQVATDLAAAQQVRPGVATLADVGGTNTRGLVERVANTPGAGRSIIEPALTSRQEQQAARLTMDLASLTGSRRTALEAAKETMAQRAQAADPLYKQAMDFNAREVPEVVEAFRKEISTGFGKQAINSSDFRRTLQTEYGISDPTNAPLMVVIDAWKKTVDDLVGAKLGTNAARVMRDMQKRVLEPLDAANPAYAQARNAWSGPTQYLEAIEQGKNFASPKVGSDEVRAALADMTEANREAYVTGALSSIFRQFGNDAAKMADLTKYLRSPEMRKKVAAIMPTPEAAAKWADRLDFEVKSSEMTGKALANSRTAVRLAEKEDAAGLASDLILEAFAGAPPITLYRKLIMAAPRAVRDTVRSRSDRILADVLTNPNAALSQDLVRLFQAAQQKQIPPSLLRTTAPTNATTAAIEGP